MCVGGGGGGGGEGGGERMNRGFTRITESTSDTALHTNIGRKGKITDRSKNLWRSVCLI